MSNLLLNFLFAAIGAVLSFILTFIWEKYKFNKDYKSNNSISLSGNWEAAWQTSINNEVNINTETVVMKQKGGVIRIYNNCRGRGNSVGGYLWEGQLQFYQGRDLMGWYFSKDIEQNTNKGIMFFNYDSAKKILIGVWAGSSYDGPLLNGFAVMAKSEKLAKDTLQELCAKHTNQVRIIRNTI